MGRVSLSIMGVLAALVCAGARAGAEVTHLDLGLDYTWNAVAIQDNDGRAATSDPLNYYSHQARASLSAVLNDGITTALRVQSVNVWGLEGSTAAPVTHYPQADGTPFIEHAYVDMPRLMDGKIRLTLGRQPLLIGDGLLLSDNGAGFNALRARVTLPRRMDLDLWTAKLGEGLSTGEDNDLTGAMWGLVQEDNRWELAWVREDNQTPHEYRLAGGTTTAREVKRDLYSIRLFGDKKDAYFKLEYALQSGRARLDTGNVTLSGSAYRIDMGAQTDTARFGRFGVKGVFAAGTGGDADNPAKDSAFRPSHAHRWNGLQRDGWGRHLGATVSDIYNPAAPFSSSDTGLPAGASGVKTLGLGLTTVQRVRWTAGMDYYVFESGAKVDGQNDLGSELDFNLDYRHSGHLAFSFGAGFFFPGALYQDATGVTRLTAQARLTF